jgi:type III pantothenate kinase
MKPDVVVDIGNSRMKWGWVNYQVKPAQRRRSRVREMAALPLANPHAWGEQLDRWSVGRASRWAVTGVNVPARDSFLDWLRQQQKTQGTGQIELLSRYEQLPIGVQVEEPACVGIDRLLNAVAASVWSKGKKAITIDAGSAVTIDLLDETATFQGGAIFPGLRLQAKALHDYTALLPIVHVPEQPHALGKSTDGAIQSGLFYGTVGAILMIQSYFWSPPERRPKVFITGGDAALLYTWLCGVFRRAKVWPEMTLEGIRIAAEALP